MILDPVAKTFEPRSWFGLSRGFIDLSVGLVTHEFCDELMDSVNDLKWLNGDWRHTAALADRSVGTYVVSLESEHATGEYVVPAGASAWCR